MCIFDCSKFWTILFQAVLTFGAGFLGAWIGIFWFPKMKARHIGRKADLTIDPHHGSWTNLRIFNGSAFSMRSTFAYVAIRYDATDIVAPPQTFERALAHTNPENKVMPFEDRICWALKEQGVHKVALDINPHERQVATFLRYDPRETSGLIAIAAENATQPYRVFLNPFEEKDGSLQIKTYDVLIKIVSADAFQSAWEAKISLMDTYQIVKLAGRLEVEAYEKKLKEFQLNYISKSVKIGGTK